MPSLPCVPAKAEETPFLGPHHGLALPFPSPATSDPQQTSPAPSPRCLQVLPLLGFWPQQAHWSAHRRGAQLTPPSHSETRQHPSAMLVSANKASCAGSRPSAARKILTELSRHPGASCHHRHRDRRGRERLINAQGPRAAGCGAEAGAQSGAGKGDSRPRLQSGAVKPSRRGAGPALRHLGASWPCWAQQLGARPLTQTPGHGAGPLTLLSG